MRVCQSGVSHLCGLQQVVVDLQQLLIAETHLALAALADRKAPQAHWLAFAGPQISRLRPFLLFLLLSLLPNLTTQEKLAAAAAAAM